MIEKENLLRQEVKKEETRDEFYFKSDLNQKLDDHITRQNFLRRVKSKKARDQFYFKSDLNQKKLDDQTLVNRFNELDSEKNSHQLRN